MRKTTVLEAALVLLVLFRLQDTFAQGTVFTYQGRLSQNGVPFTGTAEIAPTLWDAASGGSPVATNNPVTLLVTVSNGLFTASLDFGASPFTYGAARWLQLGVRTTVDPFTILSPLQPLTATPYAIKAGYVTTAGTATNFTGPLAGNVTGTQGATVVASVGGQTAAAVASGASAANAATSANTANTIVKRDASGNFSAGAITGYVTTAGTATSFSGLLAGDATGTQGATVVANVGGQTAAAVASGASAANAATSANTANTIVKRDASGNFSAGAITATSVSGNGANLTALNAGNLTGGIVPLARLSGITSNQLDAATWLFLIALASGGNVNTNPLTSGTNGMVLIPGGSFTMGNSIGDSDITDAATVTPNVSAFFMDMNLVTLSQWQGVYTYATSHGYGLNAGAGNGTNHPVQMVDWYDCVKWCNARSQQAGKTPVYYTDAGLTRVYTNLEVTVYVKWSAKGYRLPTEAEWEKAARGGLSGLRFPWGNLIWQMNANYSGDTGTYYDFGPNGYNPVGNAGGITPATSPVRTFAPNGYGLYDMAGNVLQWCWDWYGTPYAGGTDPRGAASGSYRVLRGGGWDSYALDCRTASRGKIAPGLRYYDMGFRSVLPPG